MNRCYCI